MTKQEAISVLESINAKTDYFLISDDARSEAIDMAISALQAQDVPDIYAVNINSETQKELETLCKKVAAAPIQVVQEPSEITDEQAILHLQSTGWMQNHDCEMYKSGLRERLADDSGDYDSLIPCEDTISRQAAIGAVISLCDDCDSDYCGSCRVNFPGEKDCRKVLEDLPSAQKKEYKKADYIMALHNEYGCNLARAEEAHQKALEYLRNTSMMKG